MFDTVFGLPSHVLIVHAVVVLAPLGALATLLSAIWPAARRRLGFISPLLCLVVLVLTPITTSAGEYLEHKIENEQNEKAIEKHADLGNTFLWFAIALFVLSAAVWWIGRSNDEASNRIGTFNTKGGVAVASSTATKVPVAVQYVVAVLAVVVAVATTIQLYRIGDAGAHATWDYVKKIDK